MPEPTSDPAPEPYYTSAAFNWIVPLRRVVIKKRVRYRELMWEWLRLLAPHRVTRPDRDHKPEDDAYLGDAEAVLCSWYKDDQDPELTHIRYRKAIAHLHRWWRLTFLESTVATNPIGTTTVEVGGPNFHARLWKGPKRVLAELRAEADEEALAEIQPFDLEDGRLSTRYDDAGDLAPVHLEPGDVLEMALHVLLEQCEQARFADVEFDPVGSFYLGTTVRSRSGKARGELPALHDNLLAMRYQLMHALSMGNCYHDKPVYTKENKIYGKRHAPEGAGVYARGMPYGGNPKNKVVDGPQGYSYVWEFGLLNTSLPEDDQPICMPVYEDLERFAPDVPLTWFWVCSPFVTFAFNYMANAHETKNGLALPSKFRPGLAEAVLLSGDMDKNKERLKTITEATDDNFGGDPLLLNNLTLDDIDVPRTQTPVGDMCCYTIPKGRNVGDFSPFNDPDSDRVHWLELPIYGSDQTYKWDELCPDAGFIAVSSTEGHEFLLFRLYPSDRLMVEAFEALAKGKEPALPISGRMAAYNPFSGQDVCDGEGLSRSGQFFVSESTGTLPPSKRRNWSGTLRLSGPRVHKFGPSPNNQAILGMIDPKAKKKKRKKQVAPEDLSDKVKARLELQIDDEGRGFRSKKVSSMIWIPQGQPGTQDPRTLANIYDSKREWPAVTLECPSRVTPKPCKRFLRDLDLLYGERAMPFPAMLDIEAAFPSMARTKEQLANHRKHIKLLGEPGAAAYLETKIASAGKKAKFFKKDYKLVEQPDDSPETIDKKRATRESLLEELSPKPKKP